MTRKKPPTGKETTTVVANAPKEKRCELKAAGGSQSDLWNTTIVKQASQVSTAEQNQSSWVA